MGHDSKIAGKIKAQITRSSHWLSQGKSKGFVQNVHYLSPGDFCTNVIYQNSQR